MNPVIWVLIVATAVSCYFSACSFALKRFSRKMLGDLLERRGQAGRLEPFLERVHRLLLLSAVLRACANLIVMLAAFYLVGPWVTEEPKWPRYVVAFLVSAAIVSVFGVAVPASWARYHAEVLLARSLGVLNVLMVVLMPVAGFLHLFDPVVRRVTGADLQPRDDDELTDRVLSVVEEHDETAKVDDSQKEMLEAVFDLGKTTAGAIMTPRTDVQGIEVNASLEKVKQAVIEYGHSRIPVYEENLDHIVGILYAKDLIKFAGNGQEEFNVRELAREAFMVPESKPLRELLAEFKARKVHLAIVLDEYGGTAGLVTIEDILEEIVGEIQDEYEPLEEVPHIATIDERTAEVDARIRVDDLNDALDIELPEDEDYDTLGGFVFSVLGHIPEVGESFEFNGWRLTVSDAERTKVRRVRLEREAAASESKRE